MHILFMAFHFSPHSGGSVIVGTEIANNLAKLGHQVTVVTPNLKLSGEKYEPDLHENINVVRTQTPSENHLKIAARRCKKNLEKKGKEIGKKVKFDFVLTIFHPFHLVPNAAISCAKNLGIPAIVKVDDAIYEKSSGIKSLQRKIERMISTNALKNASNVLVVNEKTKNIMNLYYNVPKEKISIVPNGVDISFFKTSTKNPKKIIFSGVMYHHRGLDVLLDSIPKLVKKIPDVQVILLGDGPELKKLQEIVHEQKIEKNVFFKGWIDRSKIPEEISDASIAIGPLRRTLVTENALPIKVLEYMGSSLPIIALEGTLPEDVLIDSKNGFFVKDSDDLAGKVIQLLEDPKMVQKMGEKSLEMVQKFSWDNIVNSIISIYEKC